LFLVGDVDLLLLCLLITEPKLPRLNALLYGFVEFENVYAAFAAGARQQVERWMEHDCSDFSLTITAF